MPCIIPDTEARVDRNRAVVYTWYITGTKAIIPVLGGKVTEYNHNCDTYSIKAAAAS